MRLPTRVRERLGRKESPWICICYILTHMGLFARNPIESSKTAPLYTVGSQKTFLIVALGNPGDEFAGTRHNIGFAAIDAFVSNQSEFAGWVTKKDLKCLQATATLGSNRVIVIKPTTFMNLSGEAVHAAQAFYKVSPDNTVVVYDELDLDFGTLRMRSGGGSAGHNGIKSIISHTSDSFHRVRIGINSEHRQKNDEKDFVLKAFSKAEQAELPHLYKEVTAVLTEYIFGGQLPTETRSFIV